MQTQYKNKRLSFPTNNWSHKIFIPYFIDFMTIKILKSYGYL